MKGLEPGTRYSFFVVANYTTLHMPLSTTVSIQLLGFGEDNCEYMSIQNRLSPNFVFTRRASLWDLIEDDI